MRGPGRLGARRLQRLAFEQQVPRVLLLGPQREQRSSRGGRQVAQLEQCDVSSRIAKDERLNADEVLRRWVRKGAGVRAHLSPVRAYRACAEHANAGERQGDEGRQPQAPSAPRSRRFQTRCHACGSNHSSTRSLGPKRGSRGEGPPESLQSWWANRGAARCLVAFAAPRRRQWSRVLAPPPCEPGSHFAAAICRLPWAASLAHGRLRP